MLEKKNKRKRELKKTKVQFEERKAREARKARNQKRMKASRVTRVSYIKKPLAAHSRICVGLAAAGALLLLAGLALSIKAQGQGGLTSAAVGFCSILVSILAVWYGVKSFSEKEKNYILAKIGTGMGVVLLLIWILMFVR